MGPMPFWERARLKIGGWGFRVFLWANEMTKELYLDVITRQACWFDREKVLGWLEEDKKKE